MIKRILLAFTAILILVGCSKDDCTKTIMTPEFQVGGGYYPSQKLEIPCDDPGPIGKAHDDVIFWLIDSGQLANLKTY
ncbi:hypothetical protein [Gramella sp. AN32]|uniref:Uncharacterized protein n=1 Tax=Christiangramia antarctica TaxID=2058158 RepID=A0ABW5X2X0_9FLAO|nr:hypothetical protein [Gramella sp. AN32]MCM4157949.1 hypothetical protein [Gramella sp. AN32]